MKDKIDLNHFLNEKKVNNKNDLINLLDIIILNKDFNFWIINIFFKKGRDYLKENNLKIHTSKNFKQKLSRDEKNMIFFYLNNCTTYDKFIDDSTYIYLDNLVFFDYVFHKRFSRFFCTNQRCKILRGILDKWLI